MGTCSLGPPLDNIVMGRIRARRYIDTSNAAIDLEQNRKLHELQVEDETRARELKDAADALNERVSKTTIQLTSHIKQTCDKLEDTLQKDIDSKVCMTPYSHSDYIIVITLSLLALSY